VIKKLRFKIFSDSIVKSIRKFSVIIILFLAFYFAVQFYSSYKSKHWLYTNKKITLYQSSLDNFYLNLLSVELYTFRYIDQVPVLSIGFVHEYNPLKTKIKNILLNNEKILSNLMKRDSAVLGNGEIKRIYKLNQKYSKTIKNIIFQKNKKLSMNKTFFLFEKDSFLLKNFVSRVQKKYREKSFINLELLEEQTIHNFIFLLIIVVIIPFLIYMTIMLNKMLKAKVSSLSENLQIEQDISKLKKVEYSFDDEIKPVITLLNNLINEMNKKTSELKETKDYLGSIFESSPVALISITDDGIVTRWNKTSENYTQIKRRDAIGKNIWELCPYFEKYKSSFEEMKNNRKKITFEREMFNGHKKEDNFQYYNLTIFPLISGAINDKVIMMEDISEIEKKDRQLIQAQKMEIVGTLAGGLAHDFNNVLVGITGSVSILQYLLKKEESIKKEELADYLDTIELSSKRAEGIVSQLLLISRKNEPNFRKIDLNDILKNILKLSKNSFSKSIKLDFRFNSEKMWIKADPIQIEQVFLNLAVNASHSMTFMREGEGKDNGILKVSFKKIYADETYCKIHPNIALGTYWLTEINDSGVGIDTKNLSKIFEPFFSTKKKDKGTGLGLSMVYNIVKRHNGYINVYSEKNVGTTFFVYLPESTEEDIEGRHIQGEDIVRGKGTILVVDDEKIMRSIAKTILVEAGYDILFASDGLEGVEVFKERFKEISLVLLDLSMPKMDGRKAFDEIRNIEQNAKILLSSGFQEDSRIKEMLELGANGFIKKPYSLFELSKKVFEIINNK